MLLKLLLRPQKCNVVNARSYSTAKDDVTKCQETSSIYETVYSFPFIRYIALLNRLKVYHLTGTSLAVSGCGLMEIFNVIPEGALYTAAYIGITGTALLSLASLPFKNTIGFLYIRSDNQKVKISSIDFWGNRKDRIVAVENWQPLLDMDPKATDSLFLTPKLADGTKYKLFVKFGNVLNARKIGQVLE